MTRFDYLRLKAKVRWQTRLVMNRHRVWRLDGLA